MFGINAYSKKNLLKRKIEVTQGAIIQKEIDIDVYWRLINLKEKERGEILKKILAAEAEYKSAEVGPYYEGKAEKVAELKQKAIDAGWTGIEMKGTNKPKYDGEIVKVEGTIENFLVEIKNNVANREFMKLQLICQLKLQKDGYDPGLEAFKREKMKEMLAE